MNQPLLVADPYGALTTTIQSLGPSAMGTSEATLGFAVVGELLERLPMSTSEFALAWQHLTNAVAYHAKAEFGACRFELRMCVASVPT